MQACALPCGLLRSMREGGFPLMILRMARALSGCTQSVLANLLSSAIVHLAAKHWAEWGRRYGNEQFHTPYLLEQKLHGHAALFRRRVDTLSSYGLFRISKSCYESHPRQAQKLGQRSLSAPVKVELST